MCRLTVSAVLWKRDLGVCLHMFPYMGVNIMELTKFNKLLANLETLTAEQKQRIACAISNLMTFQVKINACHVI
jgi:hypothetical protein